ncbi:carbohydrate ABC transporter permease [Brachybacterium halotolerans subsp. kimchii]|uniref:carbohydrate ABC transporter permease n=1 Tax=Brachybacterium halotolerans TaxID=2795215 RepID=UPI001E2BB94E|nr:carbohydrate ABC transporter permease [Brachybacterium halotolerans]UEJ81406.1 carbohydrate ABC transporter permease [Brachybacterium halotolerans subsp. kimchii]
MSTAQSTRPTAAPAPEAPKRRRRRRMIDGIPTPGPVESIIKGIVLLICCAAVVVPFIGVVSTSIATPEQVTDAGGFVLLPKGLDFDSYRLIFAGGVVTRALGVSIFVTVVGTAISLALTASLGWALSRRGTFGNRPLLLIVLISLLFGPGIIPGYLVVQQLGLLDTLWALIIPTCVSAFNVVVVRSFFVQLPQEILDSAKVDGAGELQLFLRIGLPLSKAVFAVVGLFYAVGYWNSFFNALLYLNDNSKWPLQMVLRTYVVQGTQLGSQDIGIDGASLPPQISLQMAILVVSVLPVLIVYPFLQRHFAKGMLTGAVKG